LQHFSTQDQVKPVKLKQLQFQMMLTQTWDGMNLAHVDQVASTRSATEQLASYSGST
jgi:hypothetical protein